MARAKKDQTETTPDTDVVQEAEAAAADAAVAVETEPAAEPQAPTVDADTVAAAEPPIEFVVVKTRHGAPYRRCGRLFDAEETRIAVAELSEDDINRLNNDPHLLVHFDAAEAE